MAGYIPLSGIINHHGNENSTFPSPENSYAVFLSPELQDYVHAVSIPLESLQIAQIFMHKTEFLILSPQVMKFNNSY